MFCRFNKSERRLFHASLTPERADVIIAGWLAGIDVVGGWDSPAGPLFVSGKYAEADITAAGGICASYGSTDCGPCTGSWSVGWNIECW
jgi:hypothetical protein